MDSGARRELKMADEKKSSDDGVKKGEFNIPYGSGIKTTVPEGPTEQRNIPYGSVVTPQQPASTQPAASDSGGTGGSSSSGGGDGGGQSGSAESQGTEGGGS